MLYREMGKTGDKVSVLGFGCMRFPQKDHKIDEERTEKQIISAIQQGVNYFDTAYMYPNSEAVLGRILAKGYRDKVMIATKLPPFQVHSYKDMENILDTELTRLQTDHIDYYLMHGLFGMKGWQELKQLGVIEFLDKAKKSGKIRHIGFSYHGDKFQFKQIIDDYPWEFCQIQYNYMDENHQAGLEGLEYAAAKGLGISIMEPLRGGMLARINSNFEAGLNHSEQKRTPAEWALRFVWNHPGVSVVLSGMNEESQIEENIRIANDAKANSLSNSEIQFIRDTKKALSEKFKIGCTGCGYCLPCPMGVNIPMCFALYNDRYVYDNKSSMKHSYLFQLSGADGGGKGSHASLCKKCGKCETHCPQHIEIRNNLKAVSKEMESFYFKPFVAMVRGYISLRRLLKV
ncbi:Aldo/keto reductase family protein [Candidatus Desulfosporosinus infrequens]|uniref:Aldo/keto reductase family protein n=1 Tax=Candidatus Desulfosporosinus infrequens TaxID=2043169 RepID=A0A2U3L7R8_9FIRM|nr:Aldo/keto reductase family protein [Candidatus Desulfosporosinus infrequens]